MKRMRVFTVVAGLVLCLFGNAQAENGPVKFRATVTVSEQHEVVPVCYGDYFVKVTVDEVRDDPNGVFADVTTVEVCYKDAHGLEVGNKVEVYGYYWGGTCPKQYCGRVEASGDSYYIKLLPPIDERTAFTYQGRLTEAGRPADGLYEFRFTLYDHPDPSIGQQLGDAYSVNDVEVADGYFTVIVNFGAEVFNGEPRWIEVAVKPARTDMIPIALKPRQPITPTPYALHAQSGGGAGNDGWAMSGDNLYSVPPGNVGIGTSSPAEKLHVIGNIKIEGASPAWLHLVGGLGDDAGVRFSTAAVGANKWEILRDGSSSNFLLRESFPYPPFSGASVVVKAGSGNVGIGTTEPAAPLHIQKGGAGRQLAAYFNNPTDGADSEVEIQFGLGTMLPSGWSLKASGGLFTIANVAVFPPAVNIKSTGEVGIGDTEPAYRLELPNESSTAGRGRANAWVIYSSGRWKTNIQPIGNAIEKLKQLRGVYFDWKQSGTHDIGMIAEEVAEVVPEVVGFEKDSGNPESLDYGRLVALLVEAFKELKAENDASKQSHEEQLSGLTARLERMEAMMKQISNKSLERAPR